MPHRRRGRDKKVPGQPHNVRERGARIRNLSRASTVRQGGTCSAPLRSAQLFEATTHRCAANYPWMPNKRLCEAGLSQRVHWHAAVLRCLVCTALDSPQQAGTRAPSCALPAHRSESATSVLSTLLIAADGPSRSGCLSLPFSKLPIIATGV